MKIMTCIALALMSAGVCAQTCNPAVARTAPDERYQPQNQSAEVLDKHMENGRFAMTVRVDISKRDITIAKFGAVPSLH